MEIINTIWKALFNNIISRPQIFIGVIVIVGYVMLKKKPYEVFAGFIKAVVGYKILQLGASNLLSNVNPIINGLKARFNISAAVADPNFGLTAAQAALESIGESAAFAMMTLLIAFLWNILLLVFRKQTKVRTLFTTGHIMVKQATVATWIIYFLLPNCRNFYGVLLVGILCGTYWSVFSNMTVEATQDLTGGAGFAIGHQQMLGVWFTDKFASKLGNKEQGVENFKLSGIFSLFDDYVVGTSVIMMLFFGIILLIVGKPTMMEMDNGCTANVWYGIYVLEKCCAFAVNLVVLKTGVRMFVNELVESFKGISNKMAGVMPAVDCAATYGFGASNAVTLGFLFGALGNVLGFVILVLIKCPVLIIPGFVPMFYDNATLGLYANNKGGFKALVIICLVSGLLQVLGSAFAIQLFGMAEFGGYVGNLDYVTLWPVIGLLMKYLAIPGMIIAIVFMLAIPQLQYRKNKENYWKVTESLED